MSFPVKLNATVVVVTFVLFAGLKRVTAGVDASTMNVMTPLVAVLLVRSVMFTASV